MATKPNRPTPLLLANRSPRVPSAPPVIQEALEERIPRRGWPDVDIVVDAGVLFAVTSTTDFLTTFKNHYAGRIVVTDIVAYEVKQKTELRSNLASDGLARNAAWSTKTNLLDTEVCFVDENYDAQLFDDILKQIRAMPDESDKLVRSGSHMGEASSIALCLRKIDEGGRVLFLTNDQGASIVAERRTVPNRHFVHVLRELVCAGALTTERAYEIWPRSHRISGIPKDQWPASEAHFICHAVDDGCEPCDALTIPT